MKTLLLFSLMAISLIETCEKKSQDAQGAQEPKVVKHKQRPQQEDGLLKKTDKFFRDKSISQTTKGAVLGAAAGALTGAAVSKNDKAKGAVIGGAVGAGAGALTAIAIENKRKNGKFFKKGLFRNKK
jgi:uncharacterized protein YcfJ